MNAMKKAEVIHKVNGYGAGKYEFIDDTCVKDSLGGQ